MKNTCKNKKMVRIRLKNALNSIIQKKSGIEINSFKINYVKIDRKGNPKVNVICSKGIKDIVVEVVSKVLINEKE